MRAFRLERSELLCAHLMASRRVYAPLMQDDEPRWQALARPIELEVPPLRPLFSPKQLLFAERETLFVFDGARFVERLPEVEPCVLFGVSACDLAAISVQDRFFAGDAHYGLRRAASLLVGLDCTRGCSGAFCHTLDSGPHVRRGLADLVLHPEPSGGFVLFAHTDAGETAIAGLSLPRAGADAALRRDAAEAAVCASMQHPAPLRAGMARLRAGEVSAETWERIGLQCVACTACTTVCPTCTCSAPRDVPIDGGSVATDGGAGASNAGGSARERVWDSCLLEAFQREASGHNPSGSAGQRVERFFVHKLSDDFVPGLGRHGCVGCGRCDVVCPGAIGATAVLRRLAES